MAGATPDDRTPEGLRAALAGPVLAAARLLLGATLTTQLDDGSVTVRLTEVEAYGGAEDPGSHAHRGRSPRNAAMFGPPGHLYVYRHLGLHRCANVVVGPPGSPAAVLLRAGEVVRGAEVATARRSTHGVTHSPDDLAGGPARLAVALGIELSWDGWDLLGGDRPVRLALPGAGEHGAVRAGPRVGVAGAGGRPDLFPWRLWLVAEPTVSTYRPAGRRAREHRPASGTAD